MLSFLETAVKIIVLSGCLLGGLSAGLQAENQDALQRRKQDIEARIRQEQEQVKDFTLKEARLIDHLDTIDFQLNQARVRANELSSRISAVGKNMAAIRSDRETLSQRIHERRAYAENRLAALYRMHVAGRLNMMVPPATFFDLLVTRRAMERVVNFDYDILDDLNRDMARVQLLEAQLGEQKAAMNKLEKDMTEEIQIMTATSRKKQEILEAIQLQKKISHAALASLKKSASALDQQIAALEKKTEAAPGLVAFSSQKGRLVPPVAGEIISRFGMKQLGDYKSFTFQSGIDIRGEQGEPVRSVFRGDVIFAEWLKGYGNMVIINHGEHYYTLYAYLQEVFRKKGDTVDTGEVIATVGETGSLKGVCLHFELRHHGKPVDPLKWLKKEHKNS
ncbi:MAG: peptidoglycan DD-metalloendopeptidase family protein [Desulfotignum sp.]|nr:peptidoglycan DD-metalloendopeptidase family protein [Desulfotignum sp.]